MVTKESTTISANIAQTRRILFRLLSEVAVSFFAILNITNTKAVISIKTVTTEYHLVGSINIRSRICFAIEEIAALHSEKSNILLETSLPTLFVSEPNICEIPAGYTANTVSTPDSIEPAYIKRALQFLRTNRKMQATIAKKKAEIAK